MSYFICGCFCLLWCIWYIFDISVWLVRFVVIYLSPFCGCMVRFVVIYLSPFVVGQVCCDISVSILWLVRLAVIYLSPLCGWSGLLWYISPFCGWSGLLWYICLHFVVGQVGCDISVSLSDWSFLLSLVCYDISFFFLIGQVLAVFTEVGINPTLYFLVFGESLLNGEFNTLLWLELIILIDN